MLCTQEICQITIHKRTKINQRPLLYLNMDSYLFVCYNVAICCLISVLKYKSPLQGDLSSKSQLNMLLSKANKALVNAARRDEPSVLRDRTYSGLFQETWMVEIVNKLSTRCPTVAEILSSFLDCSMVNTEKKLPPICLIYSIFMFMRCHELSRVQRINTNCSLN